MFDRPYPLSPRCTEQVGDALVKMDRLGVVTMAGNIALATLDRWGMSWSKWTTSASSASHKRLKGEGERKKDREWQRERDRERGKEGERQRGKEGEREREGEAEWQ